MSDFEWRLQGTGNQWGDTEPGLREMRRVARDRVVVLTFDGDALERFWLAECAPELMAAERVRYPKIQAVRSILGDATVRSVPVPSDCRDGFTEAFYVRPEAFLDPSVRASQSAWSFVPEEATVRAVARLSADLASGEWERRFGYLRSQPTFDGSLRLIVGESGVQKMGLSGGLSNLDLHGLPHSLTAPTALQHRRRAKSKAGWSDGRREFGTVSGAIKVVLARSETEMRMKDIHVEVERLLSGTVSFQSVADYLIKNSKGPKPLFEKPKYGHYRLLRFEPG